MSKLTEEQAQEMLKQLSAHFRQPVMPVSRYCDAMYTWEKCIHARAEKLRFELFPGLEKWRDEDRAEAESALALYRKEMADPAEVEDEARRSKLYALQSYLGDVSTVERVSLMIRKSSLLDRLIYGGQKLRPTICPEHNGHWSGLEFPDMPGHPGRVCEHGCNLTGWIPAKE